MSSPEHKALIWNLIREIRIGMLITQEEDNNSMCARPMSIIQDAYDGTLYFFISKDAARIYEAENEKKEVCITFSNPKEQVYVSLSGKAEVSQDKELIDRYWSKGVSAWFPKGRQDEDVAMLVINVYKGEHWNVKENGLVQLFEMVKASVLQETPEIGTHEKFGV